MSQVLPPLLIGLAALALVLVLLALWSSVRALLSAGASARVGGRTLPERARLLDEKKTLLNAIKDLQFERDVGKLSQDDFERLDARYRASARDVLHALEQQVGPHRERARSLIGARLAALGGGAMEQGAAGASGRGAQSEADGTVEDASTGAPNAAVAAGAVDGPVGAVHACGASNDADAVFCKKCGARLREESQA